MNLKCDFWWNQWIKIIMNFLLWLVSLLILFCINCWSIQSVDQTLHFETDTYWISLCTNRYISFSFTFYSNSLHNRQSMETFYNPRVKFLNCSIIYLNQFACRWLPYISLNDFLKIKLKIKRTTKRAIERPPSDIIQNILKLLFDLK